MSEHDEAATLRSRVERLERRLERERSARLEAERIAENGMRQLYEANRRLEDRVAERTSELERSLAAATMAADAKERFLGDLGHELITPLHNVLGLLELVDPARLDPDDRERLTDVTAHANRLRNHLHGLIELTNADGPPNPADRRFDTPSAWLDKLVVSWTRPAAARGQLLLPAVDGPGAPRWADWGRLRRIADALVDNAARHGGAGPVTLTVSTDSAPRLGGEGPADVVAIVVTDTGPGLPAEIGDSACEPFVAAGDRAGIGIGLAVAERLARAAGGGCLVRSTDTGTTATAWIPATESAPGLVRATG